MTNETNGQLAKLTQQQFKELVSMFTHYHDDLDVKVSELHNSVTICVSAHADDTRKLIGGEGIHHRSLQTIFGAITGKHGKKCRLIIEEPRKGEKMPLTPFAYSPNWDATPAMKRLTDLCAALFEHPHKVAYYPQGGDTSSFEVIISGKESQNITDGGLGEALSRIFNAIGKSTGRKLYVDLVRQNEKESTNESQTPVQVRVSG